MMKIQGRALTITAVPEKAVYTITQENGSTWEMSGRAYVELSDRTKLYLDEAEAVQTAERKTGTWHGIGTDYTLPGGLVLHTLVYVENTRDDVYFVNRLEGDRLGQIRFVSFPSAVEFDAPEHMGYTVLPRMQGTIIPAGHPIELRYGVDEGQDTRMETGIIYERNAYIPLFGQVRYRQPDTKIGRGTGYMLVYDTPYDANYALQGENIQPLFKTSLGHMSYPRKLLYRFFADCDYNDFAHSYREYLEERGQIVTLAEKCAKNPAVERLLGQPIIHEGIATHISEQSHFYNPEDPEANDHYISFAKRAEQLKTLKERGLDGGYIHLDGWGLHGYDNLHPDVMPPHEGAGGAEGMKQLSDTARELGYIFGIHDQYRDYYYDAPSFDFANAVSDAAGNHPYSSYWYGGPHTVLCATLAPDYVRRNYDEFERLGIVIEGSYLDVFSVVPNDECFNPEHPMTREQCARARMECFEVLTAKGIIPSSEEVLGCMVPSLVLCHHAPYYTANWRSREAVSVGIHFPLLNLVYHDCIVIPWLGYGRKQRGGWGIPGSDAPYMHGILNGNPVYCPITAEAGLIEEVKEACALAGKLAKQRMIRHEFLDDTFRRQRTVWEDGTVVEVDMDSCEYTVTNA